MCPGATILQLLLLYFPKILDMSENWLEDLYNLEYNEKDGNESSCLHYLL